MNAVRTPPRRPAGQATEQAAKQAAKQAARQVAGRHEDEALSGIALGGRPRSIRFPPYWHAWFGRQTEPRLAALDELVDAHVERRALGRYLRRLKHAAAVAFIAAAAAAHWFSDQIAWLAERVPILRAFWKLVVGA